MVALFNKLTTFDHDNLICITNGGQSVSNNYNGDVSSCLSVIVDCILDSSLVDLVKSGGCLIEE